jgi:TPR repeat protein
MLLAALAALALTTQDAPPPAPATPIEQLGAAIGTGQTSGPDFEAARAAVMADARRGDPAAMNMAGILAQNGLVNSDRSAEDWYRAVMAGNNGDEASAATLNLALLYYGAAGRAAEARALLEGIETAPPHILSQVQGYLGFDYLYGVGGEAKTELGRASLNGAIINGFNNAYILDAYGQFWLEPPEGVEPRPDRADEMFRRAAQAGSVNAAWRLAMLILSTGGQEGEAWQYIQWASEQGHGNAMVSRAVMLALGQGVEANPAEARVWYLNAAKAGESHGLRGLGWMYVTGEGGDANPPLGYAMLDIAAEAGDPGVAASLSALADEGYERPSDAEVRAAREAFTAAEGLNADSFGQRG